MPPVPKIILDKKEDSKRLSESRIFRERSSPGESQITLGAWVSITNDKQARKLHEIAQYLRKIPIKYWPNGE